MKDVLKTEIMNQEAESEAGENLWEHLPLGEPAPCDRYKHACCLYGRFIYVHGGRENGSLGDFWRYNIECNEWEQLKCTEEKLEGHSMVAYQGVLCVFGGVIDSAFTQGTCPLWMYEIDAAEWILCPRKAMELTYASPDNRKGHSAVVYGSSMYIYGGYLDLKGPSSEFLAFNFDTRTWSPVSPSFSDHGPRRRHLHSAVVYGAAMYLFGGLNVKDEQNDLWKWNFNSNTWSSVRASYGPPKTMGHSSVVYRDSMLIFGGGRPNCASVNSLWKFQFNSQTWRKLAALQDATHPSKMYHSLIGFGCSFQPYSKHSLNDLNYKKTDLLKTSSKQVTCKLGYFHSQRPNKVSDISDGNVMEMRTFTQSDLPVHSCSVQTCFEDSLKDEVQTIMPTENNLVSPFVEDKAVSTALTVEKDKDVQCQHKTSLDMTLCCCPDILLLIGGKPFSSSGKITLWKMKPSIV
ncbi:leucine-zipper-like transcriptional regulator 1 homolog isoform X2 [Microcaecilia unicolor]|nr:leucine-zipper-like transcriptional regulator 1 homolog isoform X2 [Microcaecilia unicolor]XP_030066401.1 leucine-zipper-like transcriptional regulator 1 homolog isoform X2 [Microcaecilia unicolor]